jgi:septum site-determining protein MinC
MARSSPLMSQNQIKTPQLQFKGRIFTLTVLELTTISLDEFSEWLKEKIESAPNFFRDMPLVVDISSMTVLDSLSDMLDKIKSVGLYPIAIQGAESTSKGDILCGLPFLKGSKAYDKIVMNDPISNESDLQADVVLPEPKIASLPQSLFTTPIRSGQQIVAKSGDLVIAASVGHGAELLADGHIHVYGTLRGRALAGISGDKKARIFCHSLDAELVSIAGIYKLSDGMAPMNQPCQIYLDGEDKLHIEPLC